MSDPSPARRWALDHLAHGAFVLVVVAGVVRAATLGGPLCRDIVALSTVLALVYAGGLAGGGRWGPVARRVWVVALVTLWTALVLRAPVALTDAYVWAAVPLACAALRALDRRWAGAAVGVITLCLVGQLVRGSGDFTPELLVPVAAVWGTVALYRAQQRDAVQRRLLVEELRGTREELARQQRAAGVLTERARIARDLHDTLAQELAGGVMLLQAAERDWETRPDVARTRVRAAADGLHANLAETRRIISDLTPSTVAEAGLAGALRLLCERAETEGAAARVRFGTTGPSGPALDHEAATTLFRIAQGALANIREHARAVNVHVTLHQRPDGTELEIRDDGRGFGSLPDRPAPARGFGIPAARARLRECGGALDVRSAPGYGTRVCASVPAGKAAVR
ncbi:sensor histidine kinase [Streptomyces roseirectus]|uniref:Sensor histidine kinase n=1 Tax=Streptomyces roseirectus TaxID=2768066 RepID=A0A7H0INF3_9ACTN|nr:sensor histidine kinase [Streptomyces roseirectus]QNP74319.1 sensor histidine kinase [Streptomyces roseirectus]